jgi:peptidoglycan/xylan/chitin deacetylase (PgdA/CDA1 family)
MYTRLLPLMLFLAGLLPASSGAADSCVVLQYHHVSGETPAATSISVRDFERQLELIARLDMRVMPLREVVSALRRGLPLPSRCLALSFDDAYVSVYRQAWPLLRRRGWPFTVFVPTGAIDLGLRPYMSWDQLRELAAGGASIENHSHRHQHLIRQRRNETGDQWRQRVADDLTRAQQRITAEIGREPRLFAWPYGEYLPQLSPVLDALDLSGFGQQSGALGPDMEQLALPRFPVSGIHADTDSLRVKLLSLPLPLRRVAPRSPLPPPGEFRPAMTLELSTGLDPQRLRTGLRCFVDGSPSVTMQWLDDHRLRTRSAFDLSPGRHRSNCTLPSRQPERYHWYSHAWFIRNADGSWYAE